MSPRWRNWRWHVSARVYAHSYIDLAHQLDDELFAYLGDRLRGAVVADCGCGPGVVTEKLCRRGAARVFAVDLNAAMLRQVRARLEAAVAAGQVVIVAGAVTPGRFGQLRERYLARRGFDLILFKRSLYARAPRALPVLRAAVASLNPGGVLAVVHPDRSLRRYAFGPGLKPRRHTAFHLFNRAVSKLGEKLGLGDYTLYTKEELLDLLRAAAGDRPVEPIPSRQRAYNLAAVRNEVEGGPTGAGGTRG